MDVGLLAEQILQGKQMSSAVTMSMLCTTMRESDEESSSDVNAAPPYPKLGGSRHLFNDKDEDALVSRFDENQVIDQSNKRSTNRQALRKIVEFKLRTELI
ncbi:hypothetical protein M8J76_001480 [Diaphorina citri]|nr:hypothetical protein M8J76_001480 [Diaphorina citri]